jgi:hypothetical protein
MKLVLIAALVLAAAQDKDGVAMPAEAETQADQSPAHEKQPQAVADQQVTVEVESALKQEIKAAREEASAAQEQFAQLKSGKLLSLGFTGGLALALQTPSLITNSSAKHAGVKTTIMPYVMLLPAYWGASEANRYFCASSWSTGDEDSATEAALAITRRHAERQYRAALNALKAGLPEEEILQLLFGGNPKVGEWLLPRIKAHMDETAPDFEEQSQYAITTLANAFWAPTLRGDCAFKKLGVWFGLPSSYSAKSLLATDTAAATREFSPLAAFGVGFAPNAYFSLLAGFSVGTFKTISTETAPGESDLSWSGTIAAGGNLDLVGALFK